MKLENQSLLASYVLGKAYEIYISRGNKPALWTSYLANVLGLSTDGVRKKLAGSRSLTLNELDDILIHFEMSLEPGINQAQTFNFKIMGSDKDNVPNYFKDIIKKLEHINLHENKKITLTCEDMPIFYYFRHPHLSAFKLYFYKMTHFLSPDLLDHSFIDKHPLEEYVAISDIYNQIPSMEVWTPKTITSTLSQLKFLWNSGKLKDEDIAAHIINELQESIQTIFTNAETESKTGTEKNLVMFCSEVTLGNNQGFYEAGGYKEAFVSANTFNSISMTDPDCVADIERWVKYMFTTGTRISGEGATQRNALLNTFEDQIELLRKYIIDKDENAKRGLMGI